MKNAKQIVPFFLATSALTLALMLSGCTNKETILDAHTPDGSVEVERDAESGAITVNVDE